LKLYKNGFILLLLITLAGSVVYYTIRDDTQFKLNARIARSLELNREASELLAGGDYAEARELLLQSLSLNKLNAETYAYLGFVEHALENYQQAYEYYVSALNMEATSAEMIKNLAEILIQSAHYAEAEKYIKYGLKDFPDDESLIALLDRVQNIAVLKE
jgi:tetratricopeptide (TPR) repeat protein